MENGGRRRGAGRPKGSKGVKTIDKELKREELRQLIIAQMKPMTDAQIEHAKGISYMVLRNPDKTYTRATNVKQVDAAFAAGGETFQLFTQAPNVQAYTDLMNRALDKPAEHMAMTVSGGLDLVTRLQTARGRLAKRHS